MKPEIADILYKQRGGGLLGLRKFDPITAMAIGLEVITAAVAAQFGLLFGRGQILNQS